MLHPLRLSSPICINVLALQNNNNAHRDKRRSPESSLPSCGRSSSPPRTRTRPEISFLAIWSSKLRTKAQNNLVVLGRRSGGGGRCRRWFLALSEFPLAVFARCCSEREVAAQGCFRSCCWWWWWWAEEEEVVVEGLEMENYLMWPGEQANRSSFLIQWAMMMLAAAAHINNDADDDDDDSYKYLHKKCENCRSSFSMKKINIHILILLYCIKCRRNMNNKTGAKEIHYYAYRRYIKTRRKVNFIKWREIHNKHNREITISTNLTLFAD